MLSKKSPLRFFNVAERYAFACCLLAGKRHNVLLLVMLLSAVQIVCGNIPTVRNNDNSPDPGRRGMPPGRFYVHGSIRHGIVLNGRTDNSPLVRDVYGNLVFRSVARFVEPYDVKGVTNVWEHRPYPGMRALLDTGGLIIDTSSLFYGDIECMRFDAGGRVYLPKYSAFDGGILVNDGTTRKALYLDSATGKILYGDINSDVASLIYTNGIVKSNDSVYIGGRGEFIDLSAKVFELEIYDSANQNGNSLLAMGPGWGQLSAFDQGPSFDVETSIELQPHFGQFSYFNKTNFFKHAIELNGVGLQYGKLEDLGDGYVFSKKYLDIDNSGIITLGNEEMARLELRPPSQSTGNVSRFLLDVLHSDEFNFHKAWLKIDPVEADLSVMNGGDYQGANTLKVDRDGFAYGKTVDIEAARQFTDRFFSINNEGEIGLSAYLNNATEDSVLTTDEGGTLKFKAISSMIPEFFVANGLTRINDTISLGGTVNTNGSLKFVDPAAGKPVYTQMLWENGILNFETRDTGTHSTWNAIKLGDEGIELSNGGSRLLRLDNDRNYFAWEQGRGGKSYIEQQLMHIKLFNGEVDGGDWYASLELLENNIAMASNGYINLNVDDSRIFNLDQDGSLLRIVHDDPQSASTFFIDQNKLTFGLQSETNGEYAFVKRHLEIDSQGKLLLQSYLNNASEDSVLTTDSNGNLKFKYFSASGGADSAWAYDSIHIYNRNEGNVGIGTLQPTAKLHTLGSVRFESFKNNLQGDSVLTTDADGNLKFVYMPFGSGGGGGATYSFGNGIIQSNGNVSLGGQLEDSVKIDLAGFPFKLNDGAQSLLSISPAGNVGIGTEPAGNRRLSVGGDLGIGNLYDSVGWGDLLWFGDYSNSDALYMARYNASANSSELRINIGDDGNSEDKFHVGYLPWDGSSGWQTSLLVAADGTVGIGSSELTSMLSVGKTHGSKLSIGNSQWAKTAIISTGQDQANGDYTDLLVPGANNNNAFIRLNQAGNVGIGTPEPDALYRLSVNGKIRAKGLRVQSSGWADFVFDSTYRLMQLPELEKFIRTNKHLPGIPTSATVEQHGQDVGETQVQLLQKIEELTLYIIELNKQVKELEERNKKLEAQQTQVDRLQQQLDELRKMIQNK